MSCSADEPGETQHLDARDAQIIEDNAAKAGRIYCVERSKGKTQDEAIRITLDKTEIYDPALPRKLQYNRYVRELGAAEAACSPKVQGGSPAPTGKCEIEINGWRPKTCSGVPNLRLSTRNWGSPPSWDDIPDMDKMMILFNEFTSAIEERPRDSSLYLGRGTIFYYVGDTLNSIRDLDRSLELDPQSSDAYGFRGAVKYSLRDFQAAYLDLSKAVERNSRNGFALRMLGQLKYSSGDFITACTYTKKAAALGDASASRLLIAENGSWCRNLP